MHPHIAYIQIGSNMGDRPSALIRATELLKSNDTAITACSSIYETAAWGPVKQEDFLNQIIKISTQLSPEALMLALLDIEQTMGRKRTEKMGPRIIDLDILFYDHVVFQSEIVKIPHPCIQDRKFVLQPMAELSPELIHPVFKKNMIDLLRECKDNLPVKKWITQQA